VLRSILPCLTYLRFNISAGTPGRYAEIHGVGTWEYCKVLDNIRYAVQIKRQRKLACTIGLQMVLMPEFKDEIMPLAHLATRLGVDYLIIKHCSDDELGTLGVDYKKYRELYGALRRAEKLSNATTKIIVKWSKIKAGNKRSYKRCYGTPFHLQISGSGLVAPCGFLFAEKYKKFHIGNFVVQRIKDIVYSDKYWAVMNYLASKAFVAGRDCGTCCLQHCTNILLDNYKKGKCALIKPRGQEPMHKNFI
jgi:hypothetical protein